jgi:hypothetical protein
LSSKLPATRNVSSKANLTELAPGRGSVLKPVTESVSFDKTYAPQEVADVAAAIAAAG